MRFLLQTDARKDVLRLGPGTNGIRTLRIDETNPAEVLFTASFVHKPVDAFFEAAPDGTLQNSAVTFTRVSGEGTRAQLPPSSVQYNGATGLLAVTVHLDDASLLDPAPWWILRLTDSALQQNPAETLDARLSLIRFQFGSRLWENIWNGIDYLEVEDENAQPTGERQRHLQVHFVNAPVPDTLATGNVVIRGGERITHISVESVTPQADFLEVVADKRGDFSDYTLALVAEGGGTPPSGIDPLLSAIEFSFKAGCPSEFDCKTGEECPPATLEEPDINYLAKDYASFRTLMLDRLRVLMPDWRGKNAADMQVALVEALAYTADQLSYFQDAVATEAYLGTARKRISIRRHARLLDYYMHEGCNAKVWLFLEAAWDAIPVAAGAQFSTESVRTGSGSEEAGLVFETMFAVMIHTAHNGIPLYRWSGALDCLPEGATHATLDNTAPLFLTVGDLLLFEEVLNPATGSGADADPSHRHVVRLTAVDYTFDPVNGAPICEIEWSRDDALPFPLCLHAVVPDENGDPVARDISVARGNIALADHGETVHAVGLKPQSIAGKFRLSLEEAPLTFQGCVRDIRGALVTDADLRPMPFNPNGSATADLSWQMSDSRPSIFFAETDGDRWDARFDLLNSDSSSREFVVECDESGRAFIRFGDGTMGKEAPAQLDATYRIGNGRAGNVGVNTITVLSGAPAGIASVRNPLPARGGADPESTEQVRQYAPQAFRVQERAVTAADWAEVAQRHPEVQRAVARFRWTGSWLTVFVSIDRYGGGEVDDAFREKIRRHLERYRLAGFDLEINGPIFVSLDILLRVCVKEGYVRADVKERLLRLFSNRDNPDGTRGFFHPDNFTFAQPLFLSRIFQAALAVEGVGRVDTITFQRWGKEANNEIGDGYIMPAAQEILRLDNDKNFQEQGLMDFVMEGGL